jgi:hypothetical protein
VKTFTFQILHYRHDLVSGEFVNVGVVVYDEQDRTFDRKILQKHTRISSFFTNLDGKYFKERLKEIERAARKLCEDTTSRLEGQTLSQITETLLPQDDGCFYFSEVKTRQDVNIKAALDDLFARLVLKHIAETKTYTTDESVWKDLYKEYFDRLELTAKLTTHKIKTQDDEFVFEHAWKNGVWNIYEPVAFNLQDVQSIKNKVYKWVGKIGELAGASEEISLHFLSTLPQKEDLLRFINTKLTSVAQNSSLALQIISEENIETFVEEQKKKMLANG